MRADGAQRQDGPPRPVEVAALVKPPKLCADGPRWEDVIIVPLESERVFHVILGPARPVVVGYVFQVELGLILNHNP